ncbi:hypothetical protein C8R47DRAFT_1144417 [Mycena vitilis]|nr:hypothetical protein C8R47DRAFT_1144417 [Mycena vitilis]
MQFLLLISMRELVYIWHPAQRTGSKIKRLLRQGELSTLLRDCQEGLQHGLDSFQINMNKILKDIADFQKESDERHQKILHLVQALTDASTDPASTTNIHPGSHNSSTSMPLPPWTPEIPLDQELSLAAIVKSFEVLAGSLKERSLKVIAYTSISIVETVQTITQPNDLCMRLLEQTRELLTAIFVAHIGLDPDVILPRPLLNHLGRSTDTLHKVHTFIEAQEKGSRISRLFRPDELSSLLKHCKQELKRELEFFQLDMGEIMQEIPDISGETLPDTDSDRASTISSVYSDSHIQVLSR